jgi:monothiol glutaredoxin
MHSIVRASSPDPAQLIPQETAMSDQAVHDLIRKTVTSNDVVLFMKGTKAFPQCGFSGQVTQMLNHMGVNFKDVNVLEDASIRDGIKTFTNWPTIPQLYVKGEFVGGCDIVREMFQQGELAQMFDDKGVAYDKARMSA